MIKSLLLGFSALAFSCSAALAEHVPASAEQLTKIEGTLKAWGCSGGTAAVEDGKGHFEIDDAKCADGKEYDFKLNSDFSIHTITEE